MTPHIPHLPPLALHIAGILMLPFWAIVIFALYCTWLVQGPAEWVLDRKHDCRGSVCGRHK